MYVEVATLKSYPILLELLEPLKLTKPQHNILKDIGVKVTKVEKIS